MGMGSQQPADDVMLEVNMTPLIDVMLVLIIMFIITIPIQNDAVNMNMPTISPEVIEHPPAVIKIVILPNGELQWNTEVIANQAELEQRLLGLTKLTEPYQVQIQPESRVAYKHVATVMSTAQRLGVKNMGIMSLSS